jgi:S-adenosylmethionine:tRNA ribosyltransferase-isomerase
MKREALEFERPQQLQANAPAEDRGLARDEVRLLVSAPEGHQHARFYDLPNYLRAGDVVIVNRSATLPASLRATGRFGEFTLNLSTHYGRNMWLTEPRWSAHDPGPLPLRSGDEFDLPGTRARLIAPYPGLPALWFVQAEKNLRGSMGCCGSPIHYGYVDHALPLDAYQTIFASHPGSAEMPSAGRPFTHSVLKSLRRKGVYIASILLHTGVSSQEVEEENIEEHTLYPEPFLVSRSTAAVVNRALAENRRVIAVGTTVVRALESAWNGDEVRAASGFTRLYIHPAKGVHTVHGLITGLHDPVTSHLAMLYALAGEAMIREGYAEAVREEYLWHEFGDSHLILTR